MNKVFAGIAAVFLVIGAVLLMRESKNSQIEHAYLESLNAEIRPEELRIEEVEKEIRDLKKNLNAETDKLYGTAVLLFTDADRRIYDEAFPLMKNYQALGVIVLDSEKLPGTDGALSMEELTELQSEGWGLCRKEGTEVVSILTEAGLRVPDTVLSITGDTAEIRFEPIAVTHEEVPENATPVDAAQPDVTLAQTDSSELPTEEIRFDVREWNYSGVKADLKKACEEGRNKVYLVDFKEDSPAFFEPTAFERMLNGVNTLRNNEELILADFERVRKLRLEQPVSETSAAQARLRRQITDLEKELDELKAANEAHYQQRSR